MLQEIHTAINWLGHKDISEIMEDYGFACLPEETEDELREALRDNVIAGEIPESVIMCYAF